MHSFSAHGLGARDHVAAILLALAASGFVAALTCASSPARADDEATEQARKHYQKGKQFFELGQWDDAIAEYREAYKLRSDSAFLFNLAQAYRRKGDLQPALDLYKNYLIENPTSPMRSDIEKRIKTLEKEMKRRPPATPVARPNESPLGPPAVAAPALSPAPSPRPAPEAASPQATPGVTPPATASSSPVGNLAQPARAEEATSSGRGLRVAGIVCGAAGLASIATAVYFYSRASSLSDRISTSNAPSSSDYQAGNNAETMQWVFYGIGAGALATGAILYYLGWPHSGPVATAVAPMFGPGLAGLSAQGTF
ncbi:MAG: tetratricopeptide repeat protein [Polyangia bacterium]|jgi:tetratricopeptide (TPR) repeat protein